MLDELKKWFEGAGPGRSPKAPEHVFLFDKERKRDYLMDLRSILRTPGARRALPMLHVLETTITRNSRRIRIPHKAMLDIVRELALVENRMAPDSPLREVMSAIPGLALSMGVDPMPTSILMGHHERVPGELSTTDVNLAARRLAEALARGPDTGEMRSTAQSVAAEQAVSGAPADAAAGSELPAGSSPPALSDFM